MVYMVCVVLCCVVLTVQWWEFGAHAVAVVMIDRLMCAPGLHACIREGCVCG
jgi:hypothetical protein